MNATVKTDADASAVNGDDRRRQDFRNAMARMGAAVNIVTSNGVAGRCGITATAVCSVSDTPPTLLVCMNRASAMNQVFKENAALCVNVLAAEQESWARDFAGMTCVPMEQRFADPAWDQGALQLPRLSQALASLQGRITRTEEVGSHTIFIVELVQIDVRADSADSLVYFDRLFHRLPCQQSTLAASAVG